MKVNFLKLISNRKFLFSLLPILLIAVLVILFPQISYASAMGNAVTTVLGWIVYAVVWVLGKILILLINLVIWVAGYNDFINAPAVSNGWKILRDLCNMFFILILLVIAFATTLNRESYAMKALLPKFIIAAVLINFSKLICGVIIDFAQVIMLTFVNGFRDIGGGNLADMLGITKLMAFSDKGCEDVNNWTVMGTYILAFVYVIVATVVVCVILFVLVMRMVMIWIYVVLSPMAWLLSVLPATQKYANQWWQQFAETVATGPILAFFIWLSFASVTIGSNGESIIGTPPPSAAANEQKYLGSINNAGTLSTDACKGEDQVGASQAGSSDSMLKFVISIGMLMGGLIITKQAGGAIGGIAGAGLGSLDKMKKWAGNKITRPVTDRYKSFQNQREKARQEKIQDFGARAYGNYVGAKGKIKGAAYGAATGVRGAIGSGVNKGINRMATSDNKVLSGLGKTIIGSKAFIGGFKTGYQDEKLRRADEKKRRQEAFNTGVYQDDKGNKFDYDKRTGTYKRKWKEEVVVGENDYGDQITEMQDREETAMNKRTVTRKVMENGVEVEKEVQENIGPVKKMSGAVYAATNSWNKATKDSKAFNNNIQTESIKKEQKKMEDAGFSPGQLLATLKDSNATGTQRMAAALTLALKEGFKRREDVKSAQQLIKGTGNGGLMKEFNDSIDKKQAHLNYDLDDEVERKKFAKRRADGKFDILSADAYKDKNVIAALSNSMTKDEFVNYSRRVSAASSGHDTAIQDGLKKYLDIQKPGLKNGELDKTRLVVKGVTGNLNDVLRGVKFTGDAGKDKEEMKKMLKEAFYAMSTADVGKLKSTSFKADEDAFKDSNGVVNRQAAGLYADALKDAFNDVFDGGDVQSIANNRNADRKTVSELMNLLGRGVNNTAPAANPTPPARPAQRTPGGGDGIM